MRKQKTEQPPDLQTINCFSFYIKHRSKLWIDLYESQCPEWLLLVSAMAHVSKVFITAKFFQYYSSRVGGRYLDHYICESIFKQNKIMKA